MHSKLQEWLHHPVSQAFKRVLEEAKKQAEDDLDNVPEDAPRDMIIRTLERNKVYKQILDFENLMLGELDE